MPSFKIETTEDLTEANKIEALYIPENDYGEAVSVFQKSVNEVIGNLLGEDSIDAISIEFIVIDAYEVRANFAHLGSAIGTVILSAESVDED